MKVLQWHRQVICLVQKLKPFEGKERAMPSVNATLDVAASADTVYAYLKGRYESVAHRSVLLATKKYVPNVRCIEAVAGKRLEFAVPGRDPFLQMFTEGWKWHYDIEATSAAASRVTLPRRPRSLFPWTRNRRNN
jgi:hypothetical protein